MIEAQYRNQYQNLIQASKGYESLCCQASRHQRWGQYQSNHEEEDFLRSVGPQLVDSTQYAALKTIHLQCYQRQASLKTIEHVQIVICGRNQAGEERTDALGRLQNLRYKP